MPDLPSQTRFRVPRLVSRVAHYLRYRDHYTVLPAAPKYNEDGLATTHEAGFLEDPRFQRAYAAGQQAGSWGSYDLRWRVHVACWAGLHGAQLAGDFVDCGVFRGGLPRAVMQYVGFETLDKDYYLLD